MDTIYVIQDGALLFIVFREKLANHSFSPRAKVSVERYRVPTIQNTYKQWNWIESTLAQSKADFLIVAGQYAALDQRTGGLAEKLVPLLQKYDVTAYLNGT